MEGLNNLVFYLVIPYGTFPWQPILEVKLVTYLHSSCWHSETDYNIAITISKVK